MCIGDVCLCMNPIYEHARQQVTTNLSQKGVNGTKPSQQIKSSCETLGVNFTNLTRDNATQMPDRS